MSKYLHGGIAAPAKKLSLIRQRSFEEQSFNKKGIKFTLTPTVSRLALKH